MKRNPVLLLWLVIAAMLFIPGNIGQLISFSEDFNTPFSPDLPAGLSANVNYSFTTMAAIVNSNVVPIISTNYSRYNTSESDAEPYLKAIQKTNSTNTFIAKANCAIKAINLT